MEREDAKDLTLSILVVVVAILVVDCVWLHVKCAREEADIGVLAQDYQKTVETVKHLEDWVATSSVQGKFKGVPLIFGCPPQKGHSFRDQSLAIPSSISLMIHTTPSASVSLPSAWPSEAHNPCLFPRADSP